MKELFKIDHIDIQRGMARHSFNKIIINWCFDTFKRNYHVQ